MSFQDITLTQCQKLSSTKLNNVTGNFAAIAEAPETAGHTSSDPFFRGRAVKSCYIIGEGGISTIVYDEGISSVTYTGKEYAINFTIPYTTATYFHNHQGHEERGIEGINYHIMCNTKATSRLTLYSRI